jgi:peroxiredoxin
MSTPRKSYRHCRRNRGGLLLAVLLCVFLVGCRQEPVRQDFRLGDPAPDFAARDLDGGVVVLSSLRGKAIILRFFESDCRFCKADTPVLADLSQRYRQQGLVVLYVGSFYERESALRGFVAEQGIDFPVIMDQGAKLADLYRIKVYPQTFFISPEQKLVGALLGAVGAAEVREIFAPYVQLSP